MIKYVQQGATCPPFYGRYRYCYATNRFLVLPIPLNLIAQIYNALRHRIKSGFKMYNDIADAAYHRGYAEGMKAGLSAEKRTDASKQETRTVNGDNDTRS